MKKSIIAIVIAVVVILAIIISIVAVNKRGTETSTETIENEKMTAEVIVNKMKEKTSNIGKVVVYNEENDLNNLLGRPNQYTSKATFEDIRLEQKNADNEFLTEEERNEPIGGTIEVFNNETDMNNRKAYIESLSSSVSLFNQYIYAKGNVLLRLENDLTPTQAKEYEDIFNEIIK